MVVSGGLQLLIISMRFPALLVTSINKSHVLTACVHRIYILIDAFLFINIAINIV